MYNGVLKILSQFKGYRIPLLQWIGKVFAHFLLDFIYCAFADLFLQVCSLILTTS